MGLHRLRIAGAQDAQELIVGDQIEAREGRPLGIQVVREGLLDPTRRVSSRISGPRRSNSEVKPLNSSKRPSSRR